MQAFEQLEDQWGRWAGVENVVACNSGTAALHLGLEALQLPAGSAVVLPDYTMVACARAVTLSNLTPIFVDCKSDLTVDPQKVEETLHRCATTGSHAVGVIMAVHVYGRRCDMDALARLAERYHVYLVEDLAEAHGIQPHQLTHAACWSFYRNKIVAGEEGGAVAFPRYPGTATLAKCLRSVGFTADHDYTHIPRGHNYRLANCLAMKILASLRLAEVNVQVRHVTEKWYDQHCPAPWRMPRRDAVWVYDVRIPGMLAPQQRQLVQALQAAGIEARYGFKPMTWQQEYIERGRGANQSKAWKAMTEVIYLPVAPFVTREEDCQRAFDIMRQVVSA